MHYPHTKGFIALMSAIIISAILLLVSTAGSLTGFYERSNILDSELKDRSSSAADACADQSFLLIANNAAYTGLSLLTLNTFDSCRVQVSGTSPKSIKIQATSSSAVTNLQISFSPTTLTVLSWSEVSLY